MKRFSIFFIAILCLFACQDTASNTTEGNEKTPEALNFDLMANTLMERADIQPGEKVLLVGKPGRFDTLVPILRQKITEREGIDLGVISVSETQPASWTTDYTKGAEGMTREEMVEYFSDMDLGIMLPGPAATDEVYAAIQDVLRKISGEPFIFIGRGLIRLIINYWI
jgi:hypothetical protein